MDPPGGRGAVLRQILIQSHVSDYVTVHPREAAVKSRARKYDASGRQARAERSRASVLERARALFLEQGYAATTVASIGAAAGVSVETIYKTFGGKAGVVRALCAQALEGSGPVPAEHRSDELKRTAEDARAIVRGWGALMIEVAPRVVPILLLVRDAAVNDPSMDDLRAELEESRLVRMRHNAAALADRGDLRAGLDAEEAAQILWTYSSPELYELLVVRRGWSVEHHARFVSDAMISALLGEPARRRR
jgi:AcrR family transcriptional regulator